MRQLAQRIRRTVADQRGAVLVLMSMSLVILMGMAAFMVDYGRIAYNRLEVRKAAEAAALAGVVHMPLPGSVVSGAGAEPYNAEGDAEFKLRFKLYPPDSTPGNWTDNKANNGGVAVCQKTFWEAGVHPTRSAAWGSTNGRT